MGELVEVVGFWGRKGRGEFRGEEAGFGLEEEEV
jgi:hypothetical protein